MSSELMDATIIALELIEEQPNRGNMLEAYYDEKK